MEIVAAKYDLYRLIFMQLKRLQRFFAVILEQITLNSTLKLWVRMGKINLLKSSHTY